MAKSRRSRYNRSQSRSQRIAFIITAIIAVLMVLSMIISMLPAPQLSGLLLPGLWF